MDYQARLREALEQYAHIEAKEIGEDKFMGHHNLVEAQEAIISLFLESLEHIRGHTVNSSLFQPLYADPRQKEAVEDCKKVVNAVIEDTVSKWQTNQEDGE